MGRPRGRQVVSDFSPRRPRSRRRRRRSDCRKDERSSSRGRKTAHCFTCDGAAQDDAAAAAAAASPLCPHKVRRPYIYFFLISPHPPQERAGDWKGARKDVEGCSSHPADSQPALHAALTLDQPPQSPGFTEEERNLLFIAPTPQTPPSLRPPSPAVRRAATEAESAAQHCGLHSVSRPPGSALADPFLSACSASTRRSARKHLQSPINPLPVHPSVRLSHFFLPSSGEAESSPAN